MALSGNGTTMDRRTLLTAIAVGGGAILAGCLEDDPVDQNDADDSGGDERSDDGETNTWVADVPEPTGDCGIAASSIREYLIEDPATAEGADPHCMQGARPSIVVENARESSLSATVEIDSAAYERTVELESGERHVDSGAFEVDESVTGSVTIGDETHSVAWDAWSCYRHAIVIDESDVVAGWIEPLSGVGDIEHDCYAGAEAILAVGNEGDSREVRIYVTDHCDETTDEKTIDIEADGRVRIEDSLVAGGLYDVTVETADGEWERYSFDEECWGIEAIVDDGGVDIRPIDID